MKGHIDECAGCVIVTAGVIACLLVWGLSIKGITALVGWLCK